MKPETESSTNSAIRDTAMIDIDRYLAELKAQNRKLGTELNARYRQTRRARKPRGCFRSFHSS